MTQAKSKTIILSSGGTGGHVFPALSLAEELHHRGYEVIIMTDQRGQVFQSATGVSRVIALPTWRGKGPLKAIPLMLGLAISFLFSLLYLIRLHPVAIVGFGGYPSLPALLAGYILRFSTALHEQNAVLGRANRFMARFVTQIGTSYQTLKFGESFQDKMIYTGNPVRKSIAEIRNIPYYPPKADESFHLLIIGGSQGARVFSSVIPEALRHLSLPMRKRLIVHQQCRKELLESTIAAYHQSEISVDIRPFFDDMDQQLRTAHLVIGRAGASTIAELTTSGRPALLVPFPFATDHHQQINATSLENAGAAWVIREHDFTPRTLQKFFVDIMKNSEVLKIKAEKMHYLGQPNATTHLAQMVIDGVRTLK